MKKIFITTLVSLSFASITFASELTPKLRHIAKDSEYKPTLGFAAGVGSPEGSMNSGGNYSLEAGYQPYIPLTVAGVLTVSDYNSTPGNKLTRTSAMAKVGYNFGGTLPFIRYSYAAMAMGPMWENATNSNQLALGFKPSVGFDYPLDKVMDSALSLGMNANYLLTTSSNPDVFAVNGVLKYWY